MVGSSYSSSTSTSICTSCQVNKYCRTNTAVYSINFIYMGTYLYKPIKLQVVFIILSKIFCSMLLPINNGN